MSRITETVERQHRFFRTGRTLPVSFRRDMLRALRQGLLRSEDELLAALYQDMRKPPYEAFTGEIGVVLNEIDFIIRRLPSWAKPRRSGTPLACFPSRSAVHRHPYGVCLVLAAWNYPAQLTLSPLLGAIAGGNCAVVKPSETSSSSSAMIARLLRDTFDEEYVAVVEGEVETAKELLSEPFDFIFFTGGAAAGREVMAAGARQLAPVALQLGGKCPCIVDRQVNIDLAAKRTVWGRFYNAGQMCVSPDYVVVHSDVKEAFLAAARKYLRAFYGERPQESPDYSRIIDRRHFERLVRFLDGASVVAGGQADIDDLYIAPTIIDNVAWDDPIMEEEIFGPILPVLLYRELSEVVAEIVRKPRPLALFIFSTNRRNQKRIIDEVPFGGGCINDTVMHIIGPHLPFGGVGDSGMGRYHGKASFDTFSYEKSVLTSPAFPDNPLRYPPFTSLKQRIGRRMFPTR